MKKYVKGMIIFIFVVILIIVGCIKYFSTVSVSTIEIIKQIESSFQNINKQAIEETLDVKLVKNLQTYNKYFDMYVGNSTAWNFKKIDLRISKTESSNKILTINLTPKIFISDNISVEELYISYPNLELRVNSPELGGGVYYIKKEVWGELRFGYDKGGYLTTVVFDSIQ